MRSELFLHTARGMPDWVPQPVRHYIDHTAAGASIRALARAADCHASTVLRQVRRIENRRDDPLVDAALRALTDLNKADPTQHRQEPCQMTHARSHPRTQENLEHERIAAECTRALRRLVETGAVLAVAQDMEMAVVVRDAPDGTTTRTAVVGQDVAQALALNDWIVTDCPDARVVKYRVTAAGRNALRGFMAHEENRAIGMGETAASFDHASSGGMRSPIAPAESPLNGLARRRDKDGKPFLSSDLVRAGERLREDFELAQMGPRVTQDWDSFLTAGTDRPRATGMSGNSPAAADARVKAALADLGPGLADIALRCCCFLEGMETTEKHMGWSARSGKIVLRIALQRLRVHYHSLGHAGAMIG
jgi:hypothetical protein